MLNTAEAQRTGVHSTPCNWCGSVALLEFSVRDRYVCTERDRKILVFKCGECSRLTTMGLDA